MAGEAEWVESVRVQVSDLLTRLEDLLDKGPDVLDRERSDADSWSWSDPAPPLKTTDLSLNPVTIDMGGTIYQENLRRFTGCMLAGLGYLPPGSPERQRANAVFHRLASFEIDPSDDSYLKFKMYQLISMHEMHGKAVLGSRKWRKVARTATDYW